ncbi:hypothetical protein BUALT_Bualt01G0013500 [Buddleja alternifolia]|uniref:Uncharacterized protein n=1 Tax=Buddleja alternifolia TaxID=168488 RepID=A0AAV6Y4L4_9LAMI|nr:hypothetical protein BUALT_Bualt01G0013500 [Buddleja alternifolia]
MIQMVQRDVEFVGVDKLVDLDANSDLIRDKAGSKYFVDKSRIFEMALVDKDYGNLLVSNLTEEERSEPQNKRRQEDDVSEDENDPGCERFFKSLRAYGNSYVFEKDEKDGISSLIKYEREESSDEDCDPEPRRKLRSAMKQKVGVLDERENEKNENVSQMKSRNKAKDEKVENVKCSSSGVVPDADYFFHLQNIKIVDEHRVYTYGGHRVVYEKIDGENDQEKEDNEDGSSSDVEIVGSTSNEERKPNPSVMNKESFVNPVSPTMGLEFRQQVIAVLRKPYDEQEYDKLWFDFELRTPERKHKELRNQRDRSCPTNRDGKSYLDHYPDLGRKLRLCEDDKPKCLNLLRGLFFWLRNSVQSGSFLPWQDDECLSIKPESC